MVIPPISAYELHKRYPKHLQALSSKVVTLTQATNLMRQYTIKTGEKCHHLNEALQFFAKRNAIAEYKRDWRRLAGR